jgi:2-polyprenyl-6-methoxyphenol hydroxylase-like FAD-dependent oxidoreductase
VRTQIRPESHAVVVGGSIAGLLAARVLSESFTHVTVVDRDDMPTTPVHRKGVPHGRHLHGLLARGYQVIEELVPGFGVDLIARGAVPVDLHQDIVWYNAGHRMQRAPSLMCGLLASRPLIESYLRSRIGARPRVQILRRTEAVGLRAHHDRIAGVRLAGPDGEWTLPARVVVDATGRGNRGPAWLAELGYPRVPADVVRAGLVYATREYRRTPGAEDFTGVIAAHHPGNPTGTGTAAVEHDRWMVTLVGIGDDAPPTEPGAFEDFAAGVDGWELGELVRTAVPLTDPVRFRIGPSVRRRYERCARLPEGFLPIGDALCCFNPAYGQGITAGALAARWLRKCLLTGTGGLTRRYVNGVCRIMDVPWDITVGNDLRFPAVTGRRTLRVRLLNAYLSRLHRAAAIDPVVAATFLRVANFLDDPRHLLSPAMLWRVRRSGRLDPVPSPVDLAVPARFWS